MKKNSTVSKLRQKLASAHLTAKQVQCLALQCYDGLSEREIARHLGIRQQSIHTCIVAARRRLAKVGLKAEVLRTEFQGVVGPMAPYEIDKLGPREIKAVW